MANAIKVDILGDAKGLTTALTSAKAQLQAFGIAANKGKILAGGAALGLAAIGTAAINIGMDLVQAQKDFALSTGLIGDDLDAAFQQVIDASGRVPESMAEVTAMAGNLQTTTGLLGDELENLTVQALDLNRLGFGTLNENQIGEYMKTWGLSAEELEGSLDTLAQVSQNTGVDIGYLTDLATSNAGAFDLLGLSHEDSIKMLGQWEKAGIDINKVARGLTSNIDMLRTKGVDTDAMMQDLVNIMDDGTISAEEQALAYELFGAEATDVLRQLEMGTITMKDFDSAMGLSGQTTEEMAEASATVGQKFSELRNRIMAKLYPALLQLGDVVIKVVDWMLINFPKGLAVIQEFSGKAIKFLKDLWETISVAVEGFVGVVLDIWDRFGADIMRFITATGENLTQYLTGVFEIVTGIFQTFKALFQGDWRGFWNGIKKVFGGIWKSLTAAIKQAFTNARLVMVAILKGAVPLLRTAAVNLGNAIRDKVKEKIDDTVQFFKDLPGRLRDVIPRVVSAALSVGKNIATSLLDGVKGAVEGAVGLAGDIARGLGNAIIDILNGLIDRINDGIPNSIPIPFAPDINLPDNPVPRLPKLRHGGPFSRGAIVGEDGPEIVRGMGSVMSRRESESSIGPVGSNITVNVYGSDSTPEAIAAAVAWKMRRVG